jgi:predicted SAM-dependent methyltransferase
MPPTQRREESIIRRVLRRTRAWCRRRSGSRRLRRRLAASPNQRRIVLGASGQYAPGWIPTEIEFLNLLRPGDWERFFQPDSIDAMLAEHVWEHLTPSEGLAAAKLCYRHLKPGGYLRVAVPDGFHPNPAYIEHVKVGGTGAGAGDHRVLYTYKTLGRLFEEAGYRVQLYEYFDERGHFHCEKWSADQGLISRSARFDERNRDGLLNYTSVIIDAVKAGSDAT